MLCKLMIGAACASFVTGAYAAEAPVATSFGTMTAEAATKAADGGDCPRSMRLIAKDLRDQRFARLPATVRGDLLTVWSRCAIKLSGANHVYR